MFFKLFPSGRFDQNPRQLLPYGWQELHLPVPDLSRTHFACRFGPESAHSYSKEEPDGN
jgi:hypothetical protein